MNRYKLSYISSPRKGTANVKLTLIARDARGRASFGRRETSHSSVERFLPRQSPVKNGLNCFSLCKEIS